MVAAGDADGSVGGRRQHYGRNSARSAARSGPAPGVRVVSSVFIMAVHNREFGHKGLLAFADCAIVIEPTSSQLAEIAIATAESTRTLIGAEPAVALLSFSTKGSGKHKQVDHVAEAMRILRERAPRVECGWRAASRRRAGRRRGTVEGAGLDRRRARQHADLS